MAIFKGSFIEFEKYVGPTTNKIITRLGKELKKTQKSCQNHQLEGEYCGVWKRLDAAHFSSKGRDRKSIIKVLLDSNFKIDEDLYEIDLDKFVSIFEDEHRKGELESNLIMLCRQHHVVYDLPYKGKIFDNDYEVVEITENDSISPLLLNKEISEHRTQTVKSAILEAVRHLTINSKNCSYAKFTNMKWQFDIKEEKLAQDLYFVFYTPRDYSFDIAKLTQQEIKRIASDLKQKEYDDRKVEKSFVFLFDGEYYIEKNTSCKMEIIYSNHFEIS